MAQSDDERQRDHDEAPLPLKTPFPTSLRLSTLSKVIQYSRSSSLGSAEATRVPSILNVVAPLHGPTKSPPLTMKVFPAGTKTTPPGVWHAFSHASANACMHACILNE